MRGVIPATVLGWLEQQAGRPIHELFDVIAGTSTGGIIALGLCAPREAEGPLTAAELVGFYEDEGPKIFEGELRRKLTSARYGSRALESALKRRLGDTKLSDALKPVLIPAYELQLRRPFVFKSVRARADAGWDFAMRDVGRATSAAPIYFPPVEVSPVGIQRSYTLVDGGIWANNPALCALLEVRSSPTERVCHVLSIGTGEHSQRYSTERVQRMHALAWAKRSFAVVMDSVSDAVDWQVSRLLSSPYDRYVRVQPTLAADETRLDDADPRTLERWHEAARDVTLAQRDALIRFAEV
jgi:patatin-like phospholipase/acyl hydrolase